LAGYSNLANYYQTIFALCQHHKYSISDVEGLLPFERDVYVAMLIDYLEKEKERLRKAGYKDV
jgi:hypothetical protein